MSDVLEKFERIGIAQKMLLLFVLLALVGVGFYFLAWQPLEEERTRVQRDIARTNEEAATLRSAADRVDAVRNELSEVCGLYTSVMDRLPRDHDFETLIRRVTGHGSLTDVVLHRGVREADRAAAQPARGRGGQAQQGQYNTLSVGLSMSGTYDQIADFFHFLSRETRVINVRSVSISRGSGGRGSATSASEGSAPVLTVSATIETYYARDDARGRSEACDDV